LMNAAQILARMEVPVLMDLIVINANVLMDIQVLIANKILMNAARIRAKMEVPVLMDLIVINANVMMDIQVLIAKKRKPRQEVMKNVSTKSLRVIAKLGRPQGIVKAVVLVTMR